MENQSLQSGSGPASGGQTEDYQAMVARLEREREDALREKRGMYEDMKAERAQRQALEERLAKLEHDRQYSQPTNNQQAPNLQFISQFAEQPREVLKREFDEYVKPIRQTNDALQKALLEREALDWLAEQEDKKVSQIKKSALIKEITDIAKERNLSNLDVLTGTQAAYEIYKARKAVKDEAEKTRAANIQQQSTEAPVVPAATNSGRVWKESEVVGMDGVTYAKHRADIDSAIREGRFQQDVTGKK